MKAPKIDIYLCVELEVPLYSTDLGATEWIELYIYEKVYDKISNKAGSVIDSYKDYIYESL